MLADKHVIEVLLADDHTVVRKGIRAILETSDRIKVIGEASNGLEAIELIQSMLPDVLVLDIQMPVLNGIETTKQLRKDGFSAGILILSAYDDPPYVQALIAAGANGYVLKTADPSEIIEAVNDVYEGKRVIDHLLKENMLDSGRLPDHNSPQPPLSAREVEVLEHVALGLTNKAIAARLGISSRTVQNHMANIFEHLACESRTEAVMKAIQLGMLPVQGK